MQSCFVCAANLIEDGPACVRCGTEMDVLRQMARAATKPRFLFGRVELETVDSPEIEAETPEPVVSTPPVSETPLFQDVEPAQPPVRKMVSPQAKKAISQPVWMVRLTGFVMDLVLCSSLNLIVLVLILNYSSRSLKDLAAFSLIPLVFVLMSFTILYFGMFQSVFQRSLGGILADRWLNRIE